MCSSPPTRPNRVLTPAHRGIQPSLSPRMHPPDPDAEARWQLAKTNKAKFQYKPEMSIVKKNIYGANIPRIRPAKAAAKSGQTRHLH
jgi:hypothetical protein